MEIMFQIFNTILTEFLLKSLHYAQFHSLYASDSIIIEQGTDYCTLGFLKFRCVGVCNVCVMCVCPPPRLLKLAV